MSGNVKQTWIGIFLQWRNFSKGRFVVVTLKYVSNCKKRHVIETNLSITCALAAAYNKNSTSWNVFHPRSLEVFIENGQRL